LAAPYQDTLRALISLLEDQSAAGTEDEDNG
jgi:hypothetical protein